MEEKNRRVDDRLAGLVHRCLAFDPDHRPQSAGELAEGLRNELAPHRRGHRWVRDHRRRVSVAASLALVLLVAWISYLVLRPPYPIRQFQRGMTCYEQADYAAAIEHFNESLRSHPKQSEVLFARGRALARQGDFRTALADFDAASLLAADPRIDAGRGYCMGRLNQHRGAIHYYEQAMKRGLESPAVLNNIGFSELRLSDLDAAEGYLTRAIAAHEHLTAAYHNLVVMHLNGAGAGRPVPESALVQAGKAAELGPPSAQLYRHVAALFACAARQRPDLAQVAIEYLKKAIAHGLDPASLRTDPLFSILRRHAAFQALLTKSPGREPSSEPDYLVDPL